MRYSNQINLNQLVIYKKARDIFKLSRQIVSYISYDKDVLALHQSKRQIDQYANIIVMDALGLAPKIAETESQKNPSIKLKYAKSLGLSIDRIYHNSKMLENTKTQGKDFLKLLRKELIHLRELHMHYVNSIL